MSYFGGKMSYFMEMGRHDSIDHQYDMESVRMHCVRSYNHVACTVNEVWGGVGDIWGVFGG